MKKRIYYLMFAAILICGAISFTACSSDDDGEKKGDALTVEKLAGLWVTDYAESGTDGERTWTRTVEDYQFATDGTGYYESYQMDGNKFVKAKSVRDNGTLHYTISGNTVTVKGDENNMTQTLTYADGKLTAQGKTLQKATAEQQTLVEQLYADWQGANSGSSEIGYVECSWDGTKVVKTAKVANANHIILQYAGKGVEKELPAGTYYIAEKFEMPGVFVIKNGSKVDLILCDGADFKVANIFVDGYGSRLRVFGQEKGTGKLTAGAENTGTKPGIGGRNADGCDLEFHGGTITAQGSHDGDAGAPAIGSYKAFRSVTIYDGTINATGGKCAAGIGGGSISSNATGDIIIYGGNINATGGRYAAGIGGGDNKRVNQINIYGGTVTAYAGADGAGIGGGEDGDSGDINIYGGVVRAYGNVSDGYGAGIGSGQDGNVNTIKIYGGDIEAYGGEDAAGIGTGEEYTSSILSGTIEIYGGKIYAYGKGYGAGIGCGEDATFGVMGISGGYVEAKAGSDCGNWSGGIGAYHDEHEDGCHIGWAGWERIYIGACMRLWTWTDYNGYWENVHYTENWWNFVHQRPRVAFGECNHVDGTYDITNCPYCHSYTLQLK